MSKKFGNCRIFAIGENGSFKEIATSEKVVVKNSSEPNPGKLVFTCKGTIPYGYQPKFWINRSYSTKLQYNQRRK